MPSIKSPDIHPSIKSPDSQTEFLGWLDEWISTFTEHHGKSAWPEEFYSIVLTEANRHIKKFGPYEIELAQELPHEVRLSDELRETFREEAIARLTKLRNAIAPQKNVGGRPRDHQKAYDLSKKYRSEDPDRSWADVSKLINRDLSTKKYTAKTLRGIFSRYNESATASKQNHKKPRLRTRRKTH